MGAAKAIPPAATVLSSLRRVFASGFCAGTLSGAVNRIRGRCQALAGCFSERSISHRTPSFVNNCSFFRQVSRKTPWEFQILKKPWGRQHRIVHFRGRIEPLYPMVILIFYFYMGSVPHGNSDFSIFRGVFLKIWTFYANRRRPYPMVILIFQFFMGFSARLPGPAGARQRPTRQKNSTGGIAPGTGAIS